eukprot:scaffold4621_cov128-Isochrysis_galbana.AAC.13
MLIRVFADGLGGDAATAIRITRFVSARETKEHLFAGRANSRSCIFIPAVSSVSRRVRWWHHCGGRIYFLNAARRSLERV